MPENTTTPDICQAPPTFEGVDSDHTDLHFWSRPHLNTLLLFALIWTRVLFFVCIRQLPIYHGLAITSLRLPGEVAQHLTPGSSEMYHGPLAKVENTRTMGDFRFPTIVVLSAKVAAWLVPGTYVN